MRWISGLLLGGTTLLVLGLASAKGPSPRTFRVWVFADAHVGTDKAQGRDSLATALRQSESASGFEWDVALDLGDMSGMQDTPQDAEGQELVDSSACSRATAANRSTTSRAITTAVV